MVYWVCGTQSSVNNAIVGGTNKQGSTLYIGRSCHKCDKIPGKVLVQGSERRMFVSFDGTEYLKTNFEILCGENVSWVTSSDGKVPANAVPGGKTQCGEVLYIGRTQHNGTITPGKVHPSMGCLFIPFHGKELPFNTYEVLVENACLPNSCVPNNACLPNNTCRPNASLPNISCLPNILPNVLPNLCVPNNVCLPNVLPNVLPNLCVPNVLPNVLPTCLPMPCLPNPFMCNPK